ncbi:16S rRNA (cytosine(1402)-N(4))-methyltransferase RsmH [Tautonia plasticadhaerens]|uniref:Ribosomal RNA small subunit methyltransferase H n=1 Tax=Tautonia plasticadhaerens TaxID=2527974 RepID=A0A518H1R5_9BACT|nr:16S rRNA (cytosine(1402)-N(4))-methyltransferase RsmH [Tautonia plasticadhaerens]QDV34782.1 Ribosomal RNA small subunit methyltransferase H [Tautonia plasticadhaerens]
MPPIHRPVMLDEVLAWLDPKPGSVVVDATAGAGGHASAIAQRVGPGGRVVGLDRDPGMLDLARGRTEGLPVTLEHSSYDRIGEVLDALGLGLVDGILADLGFASDQMDTASRGFSFQREGPLDMRFDPGQPTTAASIVNRWPADRLADAFRDLGDEPRAKAIADRIVAQRAEAPIETTGQLADLVRGLYGPRRDRTDPATRVFQALRIAVNDELGILDRFLGLAPDRLRPGGRFVVISFHSLEDERIKAAFRSDDRLRPLTKRPVVCGDRELRQNPRSRSAKLRAAERV